MANMNQVGQMVKKWGAAETLDVVWIGAALVLLFPVTTFLEGSFPVFTVLWLIVPLVALIRSRSADGVGLRVVSWRALLITTAINLAAILLIAVLVEPWSHTYQELVNGAMAGKPPDTTFAWLVRYEGGIAWGGLLLYSGLVTIFGEELFFRGWLLQLFQRRMNKYLAIALQAFLFTLPQLLPALILSPIQGLIYVVAYSLTGVGMVGGWAAWRTQSIWPSLISATIWNAIMCAWALSGR
jgi:membrane protease YdiL (CAAX protease family)